MAYLYAVFHFSILKKYPSAFNKMSDGRSLAFQSYALSRFISKTKFFKKIATFYNLLCIFSYISLDYKYYR